MGNVSITAPLVDSSEACRYKPAPFCSVLYWASQRRIAVWPMLMLSLTRWTLRPFL